MREINNTSTEIKNSCVINYITSLAARDLEKALVQGIKEAVSGTLFAANREIPTEHMEKYGKALEMSVIAALGRFTTAHWLVIPVIVLTRFGSVGVYVEDGKNPEESILVFTFLSSDDTQEPVSLTFDLHRIFSQEIIEATVEVRKKNERS